jgi:hypothetical protein
MNFKHGASYDWTEVAQIGLQWRPFGHDDKTSVSIATRNDSIGVTSLRLNLKNSQPVWNSSLFSEEIRQRNVRYETTRWTHMSTAYTATPVA